ncbi:hypothetical protein [Nesterenkonia alba]|uniref:hypothetical protein n=1 Tax=Nesterenkonia alba TaxID=515814 RepID=UPI00146C4ABD|nr:hypothetical protein [Nesterenkonia alba]
MTNAQMDPWSTGTPAYRAALVTGMGATFLGVVTLITAAFTDSESLAGTLRTTGLVLVGVGLLSHLVGIGLRKRQALQIVRNRKSNS